jgi:hypothetical protein
VALGGLFTQKRGKLSRLFQKIIEKVFEHNLVHPQRSEALSLANGAELGKK